MNNISLAKVISRFITNIRLTKQRKPIMTISGGQDSMLLFFILLHFYGGRPEHPEMLHFHHFWSRSNFLACWHILKLQYYFSLPTTIILAEYSTTSETRAKLWREKSLERVLHFSAIQTVFIGQTASDTVETGLFQLCRGVGIQTLQQKGYSHSKRQTRMPRYFAPETRFINRSSQPFFYDISQNFVKNKKRTRSVPIYFHTICFPPQTSWTDAGNRGRHKRKTQTTRLARTHHYLFFENTLLEYHVQQPLQRFYRSDISKLVKDCTIPLVPDSTNQNIKMRRNRIRLQLLPTLRYFFNPQFDHTFTRFLTTSTDYSEFVTQSLLKILREVYTTRNKQKAVHSLTTFERKLFFQTLYRVYAGRQLTAGQSTYLEKTSLRK